MKLIQIMPQMTVEEVEELREIFEIFNANGEETISRTEMMHILEAFGKSWKDKEPQKMISETATDGKYSKHE